MKIRTILTAAAATAALALPFAGGPAGASVNPPVPQWGPALQQLCASPAAAAAAGYVVIVGTPANNLLVGGPANNAICGLAGNDVILGGGGHDLACAGPGNDRVEGGTGHDTLFGESGIDILLGQAGFDFLDGGVPVGDNCQVGAGGGVPVNCP